MAFPTLEFAVFFVVVLSVSWLVRRHRLTQKIFLLLVSYWFYAAWDYKLLALIIVSSLIDYLAGEGITRSDVPRVRKAWLGFSIAANLGLLGVFKYYNFFTDTIADLLGFFGLTSHLPVIEILLPVAISFYTFQSMAYTIDLYRGHGVKAKSLLDFLLFISFFPQLLAGPICRSRDLLPQLEGEAPDSVPDLSRAASLILSGLFKKAVLATFIDTHIVTAVFDAPENYAASALWAAMFGYTIQVYMDFSGYTDLARGLGLLLGFQIPENFNHPYVATNIGEFWRRWHITFSNWLRDYIYFPLGGSKCSKPRTYLNLMLTMLACGLWHGAHWKFVIWGGIHGAALVLYKAGLDYKRWRGGDPKVPDPRWRLVGGWAWTFFICSFSRVFFKSADFETAGVFAGRMFNFSLGGEGFELLIIPAILLGLALNFWGPKVRGWFINTSDAMPLVMRPVAWFAAGMVLLALKPSGIAPYIYFGF